MPFVKGQSKTGGRAKDVPNKVTKPLKDTIESFVNDEWHNVPAAMQDLWANDPKTAIKIMLDLMEFFMPKMKAVDHNFGGSDLTINVTYKKNDA